LKHVQEWAVIASLATVGLFVMGLAPTKSEDTNTPNNTIDVVKSSETVPNKESVKTSPPTEKAEYVGTDTCLACHEDRLGEGWLKLPHGRFLMDPSRKSEVKGCEECHGPGSLHVEDAPEHILNPDKVNARQSSEVCLKCHANKIRKHDWQVSIHSLAKVRCSNCHKVHAKVDNPLMLVKSKHEVCYECHKTVRGQFLQNSHHPLKEGKMDCSDCHNVHGGTDEGLLKKDEKKTCTDTCHRDKRGPFIHEHDPTVNGYTQPCTSCHRPHGSPNVQLLKFNGRGLCLQCHATKATKHFPGRCWNCHTHTHGSNVDPKFLQ
jgi:DmsE family decaheme c-type cytochrome